MPINRSSRQIIRDLLDDGWELVRTRGSHHHYRHPEKPGLITVPHAERQVHPKTAAKIYKAADIEP